MNKSKLLAIAVLVLLVQNTFADEPGGFGVKGGIGFSTLSFDKDNASDQKNRMKIGGMVGFSYEAFLGKKDKMALDIEALLANKGVQQKSSATILGKDVTTILKTNLYTVDIPVSFKYYPIENFNIYAGPYYSFLAAAQFRTITKIDDDKDKEDGDNWFKEENKDINGEYFMNRHDVGINAGLEFVTDGGFGVGARFQKGFMDLTNDDYLLSDDKRVTNTGIQVYGVIRF
jgi:hypothetical protein